jgi:hypothetical protein
MAHPHRYDPGDMNTKQATLFSWEQFAAQANEIERRRKQEREGYEKSLLLVNNYSPQKMGISLATNDLRTPRNLLEQEQQNSMPNSNTRQPMPITPIGVSLIEPLALTLTTPKTPAYELSWGEWIPTPDVFKDGWPICLIGGWLDVLRPPVVLLKNLKPYHFS